MGGFFYRKYEFMSALTWYKIDDRATALLETKFSYYLKTLLLNIESA